MFHKKEGILESYNTTRHNEDYKNYLIIATIEQHHQLSDNDFHISLMKWAKKVKDSIHNEDFGFVINAGNIFVIVNKEREKNFLENMKHVFITREGKSYSVISNIMELRDSESSLIMRDSK